jgi:hypothetical protein
MLIRLGRSRLLRSIERHSEIGRGDIDRVAMDSHWFRNRSAVLNVRGEVKLQLFKPILGTWGL